MLPSDATRIKNGLECLLEIAKSDESTQYLVNDLQLLATKAKMAHEENLASLNATANNIRSRQVVLRGAKRDKFFKDWDWSDDELEIFKSVLGGYANWEYPCMEIFPGKGSCLPFVVGAEPLYIADWDEELMTTVANQFNEYYANKRLMRYTIKDFDLNPLPQNSFGFIYAINWLRSEDMSNLLGLARNVLGCLMPGGVYLFSFNPSDKYWGVRNMEEGYSHGADTAKLMTEMKKIGFQVLEVYSDEHLTYMTCKRPGEIKYVKASSINGIIEERPEDLSQKSVARLNKNLRLLEKIIDYRPHKQVQ